MIVICNVRWAPPCSFAPQFRESCQLDLQHMNSSISPEIHVRKGSVNVEKNRVNFIVTVVAITF